MSSVAENRITWHFLGLHRNPGSSMSADILLATDGGLPRVTRAHFWVEIRIKIK